MLSDSLTAVANPAESRPPLARQATFPLGYLQLAHIEEGREGEEEGRSAFHPFQFERQSHSRSDERGPRLDRSGAAAGQLPAVRAVHAAAAEGSCASPRSCSPHSSSGSPLSAAEAATAEEALDSAFNRWCGSVSGEASPPSSPSTPPIGHLLRIFNMPLETSTSCLQARQVIELRNVFLYLLTRLLYF